MRPFHKLLNLIKLKFNKSPGPNNTPLRTGLNREYIFIHINKTGGTSIGKVIDLPLKSHLTAREIIDLVGQIPFKNAFKFAVVRNPWSKVVSHYNYRLKSNQNGLGDNHLSFKEWVKCTYGENKNPIYYDKPKMFLPQTEWLKDYSGQITINHILRFETLSHDFKTIANTLGISKSLPHYNKTDKTDYRQYYDEETKVIVERWFKEDIVQFSYSF